MIIIAEIKGKKRPEYDSSSYSKENLQKYKQKQNSNKVEHK